MTRACAHTHAHTYTRVPRRAACSFVYPSRRSRVNAPRRLTSFPLQPSFSSSAYLRRTHASAVTGSLYTSPSLVILLADRSLSTSLSHSRVAVSPSFRWSRLCSSCRSIFRPLSFSPFRALYLSHSLSSSLSLSYSFVF